MLAWDVLLLIVDYPGQQPLALLQLDVIVEVSLSVLPAMAVLVKQQLDQHLPRDVVPTQVYQLPVGVVVATLGTHRVVPYDELDAEVLNQHPEVVERLPVRHLHTSLAFHVL
jgi:hypothetical protein